MDKIIQIIDDICKEAESRGIAVGFGIYEASEPANDHVALVFRRGDYRYRTELLRSVMEAAPDAVQIIVDGAEAMLEVEERRMMSDNLMSTTGCSADEH